MKSRLNMSIGRSHLVRRPAVQTQHTSAQHGERAIRWVKWVAAILNILVKLYPAETAVLRQIFPSEAPGAPKRALRRRFRNCLRYVDCTTNSVDRRRIRRRA
jgi:hypothetical protein